MPNSHGHDAAAARRLWEIWDDGSLVKWGASEPDENDDEQPLRVLYLKPQVDRWLADLADEIDNRARGPDRGLTLRRQAFVLCQDFVFTPEIRPRHWPRIEPVRPPTLGMYELRAASFRLFGGFVCRANFVVGSCATKAELKHVPPGREAEAKVCERENYDAKIREAEQFLCSLPTGEPKIDKRPLNELL